MSQQPFGDIPLFRELERLLAAGGGPINLEIARQIGLAAATQGLSDVTPEPQVVSAYNEVLTPAREYLAGVTRLDVQDAGAATVIGRGRWVTDTLTGWRWLLEHLATHLTKVMGPQAQEDLGLQMGPMVGQIAPLMLGIQAGTMVGKLAEGALGRYDLPIPRDDDGALFFVDTNVISVATSFDLDTDAVRRWLSIHDAARDLVVVAVRWLTRYSRSLLTEIVDTIEVDVAGLGSAIAELQSRGPEALQEGLGPDLLPIVQTERRRRANERLHAFVALWEGYAGRAARQVAPALVDDAPRVAEAMARRAATQGEGEAMMSGILGLTLDRALSQAGETFCAAITKLHGPEALNTVWAAPDNLPSLAELRDPFQWIERVLDVTALPHDLSDLDDS